MRILITLLALCVALFADVPNGSEITQTVTINSAYVSETTTDFLLQFKVPRTGDILANCTSAANVAMTNLNDTLRRARCIVYTADTLYVYAHVAKSTSADVVYRLHYGLTLNEVNSSSAFTNCGVTNYWGFNEQSGTTVADYANGLALTVGGGSTLGNAGVFYNGLTGGTSGYAGVSNAVLSGKTAFTLNSIVEADPVRNEIIYSVRTSGAVVFQFFRGGTLSIDFGGGNTASGLRTVIPNSISYVSLVFDGSKPGNSERLKLYVNGISQSITYTGTIPSAITTYSVTPTFDVGGYRGGDLRVKGTDESSLSSTATSYAGVLDRYRTVFTSTFWTLGDITGIPGEASINRWRAFRYNNKWEAFK